MSEARSVFYVPRPVYFELVELHDWVGRLEAELARRDQDDDEPTAP